MEIKASSAKVGGWRNETEAELGNIMLQRDPSMLFHHFQYQNISVLKILVLWVVQFFLRLVPDIKQIKFEFWRPSGVLSGVCCRCDHPDILSLFHKISVVEYSQYFEYLEITKKGGGTHGGQYVGRKDVVCVL